MFKKFLIGGLILIAMTVFALSACGDPKPKFSNSIINVELENEVSLQIVHDSLIITSDYFLPKLSLKKVVNLTDWAEETIRKQLSGEEVYHPINLQTFRIMLTLTLQKSGHKNILKALEILNARDDVYLAERDFGYGSSLL